MSKVIFFFSIERDYSKTRSRTNTVFSLLKSKHFLSLKSFALDPRRIMPKLRTATIAGGLVVSHRTRWHDIFSNRFHLRLKYQSSEDRFIFIGGRGKRPKIASTNTESESGVEGRSLFLRFLTLRSNASRTFLGEFSSSFSGDFNFFFALLKIKTSRSDLLFLCFFLNFFSSFEGLLKLGLCSVRTMVIREVDF